MPDDRGIDVQVAVAFHERYEADKAAGTVRPLAHYLGLFPGHDATVAREYLDVAGVPEGGDGTSLAATHAPAAGTARIGPYRILEEAGRGGQGVVYRAEDTRLGRFVALKVLARSGDPTGSRILRFQREAAVASRLDHPGICALFEAGSDDGAAWIAMRWVEGESLARRIASARRSAGVSESGTMAEGSPAGVPAAETASSPARSRLTSSRSAVRDIVGWFAEAARSLHAAHEAGVVHRDVKPANLMVVPAPGEAPPLGKGSPAVPGPVIRSGERPVILDFGLARDDVPGGDGLTATGDIFGTPAYMAPEQIRPQGDAADARTDVYALGVALFETLTLRRPFEAPTREALYREILIREPADVRRLNPAVPRDLATVVATALEKDRDRRYRSAEALARDLEAVLAHRPVAARPLGPIGRSLRWARREPFRAAVVVLLALGLPALGGLTAYIASTRDEVRAADLARRHRETEDLLETGYLLALAADPDHAIGIFEGILDRDPGNIEAIAGVAIAYRLSKQVPEALAFLDRQPGRFVASPGLGRLRAALLHQLRRNDESALLKADLPVPESAVDFFLAGEERLSAAAVHEVGAANEALDLLMAAILRSRQARALYHFHATCAAALAGDHATALRLAGTLRELWGGSPIAHCWAAFALMKAGDPEAALRDYDEARRLDPDLGLAWFGRANVLMCRRDWDGALEAHRKAAEIDPRLPAARIGEAECLISAGRAEEARELAERMALDRPGDVNPLLVLGRALVESGRPGPAVEILRQVVAQRPGLAAAQGRLGAALDAAGDSGEAEAAFRRALELDPSDNDARNGLAKTLVRRKDLAGAREVLEVAAQRPPADPDVLYNLGFVLVESGNFAEALPWLRKCLEFRPDHDLARLLLGRAQTGAGDDAAAIETYREAVRGDPGFAEAWCNLGQGLRRAGEYREAVACLARGHELGSKRPEWPYDSGEWLDSARTEVRMESERDEALADDRAALDVRAWIRNADFSVHQRRPAAEAACLGRALAADPAPDSATASRLRIRAARAAASAAAVAASAASATAAAPPAAGLFDGGADAAAWRARALDWLRAELTAIEGGVAAGRIRPEAAVRALEAWLDDAAFASLRGEVAVSALPESEAAAWNQLWSSVQSLAGRL